MIQLNLSKSDCKNLADAIETYLFPHKGNSNNTDNIEYVRDMLRGLDELRRVSEE